MECRHKRIALEETPKLSTTPITMPIQSAMQPADQEIIRSGPIQLLENHAAQGSVSTSTCATSPQLSPDKDAIPEPKTSSEFEDSVDSRHTARFLFPCTTCRDKKVKVRGSKIRIIWKTHAKRSKCSKEKPMCWACSRMGRECVYPGKDRRLPLEDVQVSRPESKQYQRERTVPSFTAVKNPKQTVVIPSHQRPVLPPENQLRGSPQISVSNDSEYPNKSDSETPISTPSLPPPPRATVQQMHEPVHPTVRTGTNLLRPEKDLMNLNEFRKTAEAHPSDNQHNFTAPKKSSNLAPNIDWIVSRLASTVVHVRAGDGWDNIISMTLGPSYLVETFFKNVSRQLGTSVTHLSILLPCNVANLDKYVVQIKQGDQVAFKNMLDILVEGIGRLGVERPVRYVLAATATCQ